MKQSVVAALLEIQGIQKYFSSAKLLCVNGPSVCALSSSMKSI